MRALIDLVENTTGPLAYHVMRRDKAEQVFRNDAFASLWEHDVPGLGRRRGTSLTRNRHFWFGQDYCVRLTIDLDALKRRHRVIPLDGEYVFHHTHPTASGYLPRDRERDNDLKRDGTMQEEFVLGPVQNLHRYVRSVEVRRPPAQQFLGMLEALSVCSEQHSIEVDLNDDVQAYLRNVEEDWDD